MVEKTAQLNVEVTYESEAVTIEAIKKRIEKALEEIVTVDMVEAEYDEPTEKEE